MIDAKEWTQIGAALVHACPYKVNGQSCLTLNAVLDILQTFTNGCTWKDNGDSFNFSGPPRKDLSADANPQAKP
jgi:hypothetical protein